MTPGSLEKILATLVRDHLFLSTMIWGPPGIGKSQIVAAVARETGLDMVDLRLGQLAPTDLRGLPVPDHGEKLARWYPPEFLPRQGRGVLFLDELNMAPPAVQGLAQQLILDRRVGGYEVPEGWFIWAAGNRREDRAAVFEMPAPLANRFLHLEVEPHWESFRDWAVGAGLHERILAFLGFRPALLHQLDAARPAWPSPRSWTMADALLRADLPLEGAVGPGAAAEFASFCAVFDRLPGIEAILNGAGELPHFPSEPSVRYATITALAMRAESTAQTAAACQWLIAKAQAEWIILFLHLTVDRAKRQGKMGEVAELVKRQPGIASYMAKMRDASFA